MFGKTHICDKCEHEFKAKGARFCPQCGSPTPGSHTDIVMIVDRSGSMSSCHAGTIAGFNRFLAEQKAAPGLASITIAQFDNEYELLIHRKPLSEIGPVDNKSFVPRGGTALLDAIGRTLATMEAVAEDGRCLVCVITDGEENASRESTQQQIKDMTRRLESKGWSFIYLGANQDAFKVGSQMGIVNAVNFIPTHNGFEQMYRAVSCNALNYRLGGQDGLNAGFADAVAGLSS